MAGRQHRTTPAGQILGVATPATPAALTPMCERAFITANSYNAQVKSIHGGIQPCNSCGEFTTNPRHLA